MGNEVDDKLNNLVSKGKDRRPKVEKPKTPPKPRVWFGSMPESNGKTNWTAILHKGDITEGFTIARSEYHDRVLYEADCVRYILGELDEKPFILNYDTEKHSGYKPKPGNE